MIVERRRCASSENSVPNPPGGWGAAAAPLVLRHSNLPTLIPRIDSLLYSSPLMDDLGKEHLSLAPTQTNSTNTRITRGWVVLNWPTGAPSPMIIAIIVGYIYTRPILQRRKKQLCGYLHDSTRAVMPALVPRTQSPNKLSPARCTLLCEVCGL